MTETARHAVDVALRAVTATLEPSAADFDFARIKLMEAISTTTRPRSRTGVRLSWATGLAILVVIAVFVVQTATISAAGALITEMAYVAEATDPLLVADDRFAYTVIEATGLASVEADSIGVEIEHDSLVYSLPYTREQWIGDGGTVRLRDTVGQPGFFSAADEAAYYAAGLDEGDHIGETIVKTQPETGSNLDEDWPTDPRKLEAKIRASAGDDDIAVLDECLDLLREPLLSPQLRSAVLQVISDLDLELVEEGGDGAGTFAVDYLLENGESMQLIFTLDAAGHLIYEQVVLVDGYPDLGVPPGTIESATTYSVPVLVDHLP